MLKLFDFVTTYDKDEKIWRGPKKPSFFNENVSAGQAVLFMMRSKNPQNVMQISDSEDITLTYGSALTTAIRIAQHFRNLQLTADDTIGIFSPETTYVMPVAIAAWFNGTPFQAINYCLETSVVKNMYELVKPKIIFCDGLQYEKVKTASESFEPLIYTLCNHLENVPKVEDLLEPTQTEHFFQAEPLKYGPNQTMAILVSSGTSGIPKGSCVSNKVCSADFGLTNGSTTMLSTSGLDWSTGMFTLIANCLVGGIRIVTSKPMTPEYLLELIVKYKINFLCTNTALMLQISLLSSYTKEAMQSIRMIFMTASHCSEPTLKRIRSALTMGLLIYAYGGTEFGGISANLTDYKGKSVGKIIPNVQLKIVDQNTGERLGPNEIGEICITHGSRWMGYYKNTEASKTIIDSEDFVRTGDLGYMDEEHYLYLSDRCKDIMKYTGIHYSPHHIEEFISEIPDVIDVCVFGVFDELKHDLPAAAVIKKEGSSLTANDVIDYVKSKTDVPYKQIHYGVFFVNELPRNHNGKLLRNKLKEMCLAMEESRK